MQIFQNLEDPISICSYFKENITFQSKISKRNGFDSDTHKNEKSFDQFSDFFHFHSRLFLFQFHNM